MHLLVIIEATNYHGVLIHEDNYDELRNELLKNIWQKYDSYMMRHMSIFEKISYKLHKWMKLLKTLFSKNRS